MGKKLLIIYEPAMCCSSGVCGPQPDQALISLQDMLEQAKKIGISVERYSITQSPQKFMQNFEVVSLIKAQQLRALPITTLNGKPVKVGAYPTLEELKKWSEGEGSAIESESADQGCCSGGTSCDIRCAPQKGGCCGDSGSNCC